LKEEGKEKAKNSVERGTGGPINQQAEKRNDMAKIHPAVAKVKTQAESNRKKVPTDSQRSVRKKEQ